MDGTDITANVPWNAAGAAPASQEIGEPVARRTHRSAARNDAHPLYFIAPVTSASGNRISSREVNLARGHGGTYLWVDFPRVDRVVSYPVRAPFESPITDERLRSHRAQCRDLK